MTTRVQKTKAATKRDRTPITLTRSEVERSGGQVAAAGERPCAPFGSHRAAPRRRRDPDSDVEGQMSWLLEVKAENVEGPEELWRATEKAVEYVRTADGYRRTLAFLARVRQHGADNLKAVARAFEADDPEAKAVFLERQEIIDAMIGRLEALVASKPCSRRSVQAARRGRH